MPTTHGRILAGLQRLATFQHPDGMFSIWCNGTPGVDITARVAHRLLGFRPSTPPTALSGRDGLPYPDALQMLERAREALLKHKHHDNALLPLDAKFKAKMESAEDAVAYYFARNASTSSERDKALQHLKKNVKRESNRVYWQAQSSWGGNLEVTADAARVMAHANDELFRPAFAHVTSKLVNGMLYSTADTRALVELLASLKFDPSTRAIIDSKEVTLGDVALGKRVTALNDNLMVRVDGDIELNHLEPRADFKFTLTPKKRELKVGERTQITITPKEQTIAPLARLFLPGNLALLKAGANAQTAYLPIESKELTVDVVAVRPGKGKLYVSVHDMYDAEKVGTSPGVEMRVKE